MSRNVGKQPARAIADVTDGTILATVDIAVPPERVYRAISDPNEIPRWWGSAETYRTEAWTADFVVGGRWTSRGRSSDGTPFEVRGEFVEIDPPRKLVQTWKAQWDGDQVTTVTFWLEPIEGGTRVTLRHTGFGDRPDACRAHSRGWELVLTWLAGHLQAPSVEQPVFFARLVPPRPTFAFDMNDAERAAMMAHAAYWRGLLDQGVALLFGPVADANGPWGLGVLRVRDAGHLEEVQMNDPAIRAAIGMHYESMPMISAITRL